MHSSALTLYMTPLSYSSSMATPDGSVLLYSTSKISVSVHFRIVNEATVKSHGYSAISPPPSGDLLAVGFGEGLNSRLDAMTGHTEKIAQVT